MKIVVSVLLTALLAFASGLYLPWWSLGASAFIVAFLIELRPVYSFLSGFLGAFLLWFTLSLQINTANSSILASKIAGILPFGGSVAALLVVTACIAGLTAGCCALCGRLLRSLRPK